MDSGLACHEFQLRTAKDPQCRGAMHAKYVKAQTSSRWCRVEVGQGVTSSGVILLTSPWFTITRSVTKALE
ncbi:hypothetical protein TNCV_1894181 [Trichonephila clavipes]|nr:hypothetical protein TNCV_1894181 [Trichonephila clavipes]